MYGVGVCVCAQAYVIGVGLSWWIPGLRVYEKLLADSCWWPVSGIVKDSLWLGAKRAGRGLLTQKVPKETGGKGQG